MSAYRAARDVRVPSAKQTDMSRAMFWFRRDLSLDDNLGWASATSRHLEVVPIFVVDPRLLAAAGTFRRRELFAALRSLSNQIETLGGALTIVSGIPEEALCRVALEEQVDECCWNDDVTSFSQTRDQAVKSALARLNVRVDTTWSTLVQPPGSITTNSATIPKVFSRFFERWNATEIPRRCVAGDARIIGKKRDPLPRGDTDDFGHAGESAARSRLDAFLERVDHYESDRDRPDYAATSRLSVDLHFGTISPREVLRAVGASTSGRYAFIRQLAWRDWYAHLMAERPELQHRSQQSVYESIEWSNDPVDLAAWKKGRTGYPIVDAAMRELSSTGWMHNRLRLIAASFLVKDLLVDWRLGERHFRQLLVDGDVSQNAGNWQWVAGTGFDAAPYFRIFNPVKQARRFDPAGDYVRRWVPELASIPGTAIHEPWTLGPLELAGTGVALGETYPFPIVDHATARHRALAAYSAARSFSN